MSKTWKRFLALLLAMTMILSLGITGFAEDGETEETEPEIEENYEDIPEETILETEPLNPAKLNVPLLGMEEPEEEDEITPMEENLDEIVRVSIFLDKPSTLAAGYPADGVGTNSAAIAYRDGLKSDQERLTAEIERVIGHPLDVCWNITLAANAISANVSLADMVKIEQVPGVKAVQRENRYLPMDDGTADPDTANTSENMVGATAAWANGFTGAGSRIAIVDTGIDTAHQSFAEEPFLFSVDQAGASSELMTQADISAVLSELNAKDKMSSVTAAQLNQNGSKIVYGFNYIDGNLTIDHNSDTAGNHGSHVAGIAAANRYIGTAHNDSAATVGAVGMAPDAQLLIMKVFGKGGGAYDSDYFVAIEDAMILGADACNLSLGSAAPGWTFDNTYQDMLNGWTDAHNSKMVLTISAGNSYAAADFTDAKHPYIEDAYTHTGGSPGSFVNSLCVAAAQNTLTKGMPLVFNEQSIFYAESTEGDEGAYTNPKISTVAGTYDLVYIDAKGEPGDYSAVNSALSLSGKVVIVNRGDLSFSEKGNNAKSYNPKALIIANNADGVINMNLADYTGTFPMVSITLKDANKIKAGCTANTAGGVTYYTGRITITNVEQEMLIPRSEATITEFSSWGVPGSLLMKPEITAPGGDIWSVFGTASTGSSTEGGTDQYVSYSGTSMAAPHMAGLTAVLAERFREDDLKSLNTGLSGYSVRAITQSLMMSTATPMAPENAYLSILQQGAGLADVDLATRSNTVVMMDPTRSYLTGLTGAASDGKVKVELGDDAARKGDYEFGFTVYNLTDDDICFNVETEIFTQASDEEFMQAGTAILPAGTSFLWEGDTPVTEGHDVNRDGVTNLDDAQAILDWLSGVNDGSNLDLEAGEMDGDDELTSYDAYLLLGWEGADEETVNTGLVPAHGSRYCSVRITLSPDLKAWLDANYPGGAFLEGFTYLDAVGSTRDGGKYEDAHSIPILGYYGSWTDATMFETTSYTETLYGSEQLPYSGTSDTNYLSLTLNGANVKFSGNPYVVEDSFPADRLAINSGTNMVRIAYNLIRCAGTTGFAVSKLDEEGLVDEVLSSNVTGNEVTGLYYHVNESTWMNTMTKIYSVNKTPGSFGLAEGDLFRVGFYAIPEYYGMLVNEDYTTADAGLLDNAGFKTLLESNELGKGAFVGFDFVIDDTAPQIGLATLSGSTLNVAATDNQALAYVAVMSLDGGTVYAQAVPGVDEYEISLDASDAIANAQGYVAVFAGDYAGNETAVAVKVNDNTHVEKTVYVLTSTLTPGEEYLIVNRNSAGSGYALYYTLNSSQSTATTRALALNVQNGTGDTNNAPYIDSKDAADTSVWTAGSGSTSGTYTFGNNGWYLRRSNSNALTITKDTSRRDWTWDGSNSLLSINSRYLRYSNNTFILSTATSNVYLYQKTVIRYEVDPYGVTEVTLTPDSLDLYKGNTAELTAKVLPLTATDRTVTWSSSNPNIATVDEFGKVTAVAAGTAVITAVANGDNTKTAECSVKVTAINKTLNSIVWDADGHVFFSSFNANNLPDWTELHDNDVGVYLHNAYMADSSTLYASTCDLSGADSVIYTVNRSTYALSELGACYLTPFGMARCAEGFGTGYCVFGFAKYLVFGNVEPEADDDYGTYSLFPYGLLDLSETAVGDAYVVAICAQNARNTSSSTSANYYFLDETGKIWLTTQSYSQSSGVSFSNPSLVVDTGLSAGLTYQSLYYDGTYLYWSHQVDNIAELIIYAPSTGKLYHAGNFGEGVWPAAGLYVNGSAAPASVEDEIMSEPIQLQRVADRAQLLTADVLEHFARYGIDLSNLLPEQFEEDEDLTEEDVLPLDEEELSEEPEPIEEPAPAEDNAYLGGLNFFRSAAPSISTVDPQTIPDEEYNEDHENEISIEIAEDEDSHNGLFAVIYDPEAVTLTGYEVNEDISAISVFVDEEKSIVTVAYANVKDDDGELPITSVSSRGGVTDYILAGEPIITLNFTVNCADSEIEVDTLERNQEFELDEISKLTVYGAGHEWGEPTWEWAEDYSTAAATFVCAKDETHTQTLEAVITSETDEATCEEAGLTTYTATVTLDGETYTDTKTVEIPATGHEWGEPTWTWAEDNTATATFVCTKDETHTKTVKATITSETVNATCEGAGSTTYTATVELEGKTYTDTKTVEIPAAGHEWGEPTWTWAEDFTSATAAFVCAKDETHTKTLEARITSEEVENGTLYTATVTLDGETYTDQKLKEITTVTVTFDAGNGTVDPATMEVNVGGSLETLPEPVLENWKFLGWFTEPMESYLLAGQGTQVTTETTFNEATTVYAHWRLPGDINGDGTVNNKDVTRLTRWLKTHDVEVVSFNLDVNGDGSVNNKDLTRLVRYQKSHDVVLN